MKIVTTSWNKISYRNASDSSFYLGVAESSLVYVILVLLVVSELHKIQSQNTCTEHHTRQGRRRGHTDYTSPPPLRYFERISVTCVVRSKRLKVPTEFASIKLFGKLFQTLIILVEKNRLRTSFLNRVAYNFIEWPLVRVFEKLK